MKYLYLSLIGIFLFGIIILSLLTIPWNCTPYTRWQPGTYTVGDILCISGECDTAYSIENVDYVKKLLEVVGKHGDTIFIREYSVFFHKEKK
jgi:hypothetical protein